MPVVCLFAGRSAVDSEQCSVSTMSSKHRVEPRLRPGVRRQTGGEARRSGGLIGRGRSPYRPDQIDSYPGYLLTARHPPICRQQPGGLRASGCCRVALFSSKIRKPQNRNSPTSPRMIDAIRLGSAATAASSRKPPEFNEITHGARRHWAKPCSCCRRSPFRCVLLGSGDRSEKIKIAAVPSIRRILACSSAGPRASCAPRPTRLVATRRLFPSP